MKRQFGGRFGVLRGLPSPAATRQCPRRLHAVRQLAEHTGKGKNTVDVALVLLLHLKLRGVEGSLGAPQLHRRGQTFTSPEQEEMWLVF